MELPVADLHSRLVSDRWKDDGMVLDLNPGAMRGIAAEIIEAYALLERKLMALSNGIDGFQEKMRKSNFIKVSAQQSGETAYVHDDHVVSPSASHVKLVWLSHERKSLLGIETLPAVPPPPTVQHTHATTLQIGNITATGDHIDVTGAVCCGSIGSSVVLVAVVVLVVAIVYSSKEKFIA